jgi:hypothetical protein
VKRTEDEAITFDNLAETIDDKLDEHPYLTGSPNWILIKEGW